MKKPFGVTASAIFALLGSLLMAGLFVVALLVLVLSPARGPIGPEAKLGMGLGLGIFGFLGAWGTTTAIGLLRMQNWGRISILVFAVLLALTGVVAAPAILLIPPPPAAPPNHDAVRAGIAMFYGVLGALGILWLYYFSRRATREAFAGVVTRESSGRPLSISIIGWWLLITGVITVLLSPLRMPVTFFLWTVSGWTAAVWYFALGALYTYIGYGLLRLNRMARLLAISLLGFGVVNGFVFFALPGRDARLATVMSKFHFTQLPSPMHFPTSMLIPSLVGVAVPLWFLIAKKKAFHAAEPSLSA